MCVKADAEAQKREILQLRQENEELRAHIDKCVAQLKQAGDGQQALQSVSYHRRLLFYVLIKYLSKCTLV